MIGQTKNDVSCRHICTGIVYTFPVDRLTLFTGNVSQAERLALEDADQEVIEAIDGWRGDPSHRRTMEFLVSSALTRNTPGKHGVRIYQPRDLLNTIVCALRPCAAVVDDDYGTVRLHQRCEFAADHRV